MTGPTLETARLLLRPPIQDDLDGFAAMGAEEETMRHIGGRQDRDMAWRQMAGISGAWTLLGYSMFSVIEKASGAWVGRIGPWRPGGETCAWPGFEVGWGVRCAFAGKGYAFEASEAAMEWAFETFGWDEIVHTIAPANTRSIALAKRLGSVKLREGRLPAPAFVDVDIYGQSREQWRSRRA